MVSLGAQRKLTAEEWLLTENGAIVPLDVQEQVIVLFLYDSRLHNFRCAKYLI